VVIDRWECREHLFIGKLSIMERPGLEARVCEYEGVVQNECTRLKG